MIFIKDSNNLIISQEPQDNLTINSCQDIVENDSPATGHMLINFSDRIRFKDVHDPEEKETGQGHFPRKRESDHSRQIADYFINHYSGWIFLSPDFLRLTGQKNGEKNGPGNDKNLNPKALPRKPVE